MNSKQLKFQIEIEDTNKENECYYKGHRFNKQRISRIPLKDITDTLYPKKRELNSSNLEWNQINFYNTIKLR